jgi:hypothetical protein
MQHMTTIIARPRRTLRPKDRATNYSEALQMNITIADDWISRLAGVDAAPEDIIP